MGLAVIRARVFPRWTGALFIASPFISFPVLPGPLAELGDYLAFIALATIGLQVVRTQTQRPAPAPGLAVTCGSLWHRLEHRPASQGRERIECRDPRDRVALVVQTRAPHAQAATPRNDREDASGNAALGWQAAPVSKLASRVVSAAGQHDRVDALGVTSRHQPPAVAAHSVTRQAASAHSELGAAHRDGAVADRVVKHPVGGGF